MKIRFLLTIVLFVITSGSCNPVSFSVPTKTPTSTKTLTSAIKINPSTDCFINIEFVPGKTGIIEVLALWGKPSYEWSISKDTQYWFFDSSGSPTAIFEKDGLDTVKFYLDGCSLKKIVEKLGVPEKVEVITLFSDIGGPTLVTQKFHYQSLGFSYSRFCEETSKDCFTFNSTDLIDSKEFYPPNKILKDSTGFNMYIKVYEWPGFNTEIKEP